MYFIYECVCTCTLSFQRCTSHSSANSPLSTWTGQVRMASRVSIAVQSAINYIEYFLDILLSSELGIELIRLTLNITNLQHSQSVGSHTSSTKCTFPPPPLLITWIDDFYEKSVDAWQTLKTLELFILTVAASSYCLIWNPRLGLTLCYLWDVCKPIFDKTNSHHWYHLHTTK